MASSKGSQNVRNLMYPGKHALLPPKIPFPSVSASYAEYIPSGFIGSKPVQRPRGEKAHHQRTSSESHLIEEQPSWLDDLLNEPESPARRSGHRRSSSDSFAYQDAVNASNVSLTLNDFKHRSMVSAPQGGIPEFDHSKNAQDVSLYSDSGFVKQRNIPWDYLVASGARPNGLPFARESIGPQNRGAFNMSQEADSVTFLPTEAKNSSESLSHDPTKVSPEKLNHNPKPITPEADNTIRVKQQFAQRSRVRKLQYIAELERNVQALQAEGSEVSAELDFLNQRNLVLSMENKALKQRLESLAQEKLIKHLEQEVLEREIGRLRALYHQPQKLLTSHHRRATSKELDSWLVKPSPKSKNSDAYP
ncbi:PREDICTED: uncharacterized protein At4g06598-like [Tarenaya hassleriana]|uniref:uncharacterized protein At4g06598-like n=1 Tax=Tarenaya hassleriana TaxID=28532 RepID=UPI00053C2DB5|nr:PREDICTED: uncharacterized protein At4g06598-like [Tarenaya hassleriana]XP_010553679.1 PREDICTED: uncharacterized protein At4g06598-like [Tarenaya hassleriana]XP_010553680.1 PREDICTED: uncharacterized protein At4g06598-like [Tarenaya hassleriana]